MEKQLIDIQNIKTKEMAYIAGYQCHIWTNRLNGDYTKHEQFINSTVNENILIFKNIFIENNQKIWNDFIDKYFISETGYTDDFGNLFLYIKTTSESIKLSGKFPTQYPIDLLPYILLGFYHGNGHNCWTNMHFNSSILNLSIVKDILIVYYNFDNDDFKGTIEKVSGTSTNILILSEKGTIKFKKLLPKDLF